MSREQAYQLLTNYLSNKNLIKHCLACETSMKAVYRHLHPDNANPTEEEKWGITGLLHDADYQLAQEANLLDKHGLLLFEKEPEVIPEDIAYAIKSHNYENTKVEPRSQMDWAITCIDQLTGLITAAALVRPDKQLASVTSETILKRMKEKSFAKGARREPILLCEEKLDIPLPAFIKLVLQAMQGIHTELGL